MARPGHAGELALERAGERKPVSPFHLGRCRRQRRIARDGCAVGDKGRARQGLEGRSRAGVGVVVMRPCETAAQRQDRIGQRIGFVGAKAEFRARAGGAPGGI